MPAIREVWHLTALSPGVVSALLTALCCRLYAVGVADPSQGLERLEADIYLTLDDGSTYVSIMRLFTASLMTSLSAHRVADELA
jgi:hypothetical protein